MNHLMKIDTVMVVDYDDPNVVEVQPCPLTEALPAAYARMKEIAGRDVPVDCGVTESEVYTHIESDRIVIGLIYADGYNKPPVFHPSLVIRHLHNFCSR